MEICRPAKRGCTAKLNAHCIGYGSVPLCIEPSETIFDNLFELDGKEVRNRITVTPITAMQSSLDSALAELVRESGALTVMLVTKQGTVYATAGDSSYMNATAMAALVAGMFSATREVARMVGEDQFSILLQQGERRHIHISLVALETMMIIVFENRDRIGIIRHAARKTADKLASIMPAMRAESGRGEISVPAFKEYALNLIDRIFEP